MNDRPSSPTDERPLGPVAAAIAQYEAVTRASGHGLARAGAPVLARGVAESARPGLALARAGAPVRACEDGGAEDPAPDPTARSVALYRSGRADDRLRRILARLRRRADPASLALADQFAAEATAALLALAERAEQADPVARRRREQETARAERLRAQLDHARSARGSSDAQR